MKVIPNRFDTVGRLLLWLTSQRKGLGIEVRSGSVPEDGSVRLAGIEAAEVAAPAAETPSTTEPSSSATTTESTAATKQATAAGKPALAAARARACSIASLI